MTMAEAELRGHIAASSGQYDDASSCDNSTAAAKKRRRSARTSFGGSGGGEDDGNQEGDPMDYHRVRTARLTRLEEMFWKDDAGYDTTDDEEETDDAKEGNDIDCEEKKGAEEDAEEDAQGDSDCDDEADWRMIRRLPTSTYLRCDGHGCRRKAVASWIEVPPNTCAVPASVANKSDIKEEEKKDGDEKNEYDDDVKDDNDEGGDKDVKQEAAEDDGNNMKDENIRENEDKEKEKDADEESTEDEKKEDMVEWNVCLACQRREFADKVDPTGWPADAPSVPNAHANASNAKTEKPPVNLNYGRRLHLTKIHDSPHIYVIDNFLTEGELKHIDTKIADAEQKGTFEKSFVDKGNGHGRKRRKKMKEVEDEEKKEEEEGEDTAGKNDDDKGKRHTTNEKQRTSRFIHFGKMADSKIAAIETRAAELLRLPHSSIEPLQLVRYGPGQYFREHHDMGVLFDDGSVELPPRVMAGVPRRVVTILVYLNDLPVEAGGGTCFPYLSRTGFGMKDDDDDDGDQGSGVVIHPKRGMAVVWANIDQTGWPDPRTVHEGCPLIRGAKMPSASTKEKPKKKQKKEVKPKPKKVKKPRKSKKKAPPPPRPRTDQILRYIVVPRSDPTNPLSSFGMKVGSVPLDGRTILTEDWSHPHTAQRMGLQLGRLKKDDVILSVNGHKVFDPATEKVLLPFRVVVPLIRATKPGRALKLDILRYAPITKTEEVKTGDEEGAVAAGSGEKPDAVVSNGDNDAVAPDANVEVNGDKAMDVSEPGDVKEECKDEEVKEEAEPEAKRAKPLPLLKYAMNIWACEE